MLCVLTATQDQRAEIPVLEAGPRNEAFPADRRGEAGKSWALTGLPGPGSQMKGVLHYTGRLDS